MPMTEYRVWVTVPNLPHTEEAKWEPVINYLEDRYDQFGPVIGWDGSAAELILATDAEDEAGAAQSCFAAVAEALHQSGCGHDYPTSLRVELADEPSHDVAA
jgi:hypothetical protein